MMAPLPADSSIGVYVHVPFCSHICPYCDFNTYAGMDSLIPRYVDALCSDIPAFPQRFGRKSAETLFLGGGTPSLLSGKDVQRIVQATAAAFDLHEEAEITLEANPNRVDERYFGDILKAGVNRLSLGAQTFDRRGLRVLGRQHEAEDVIAAVKSAKAAGFANISCDMIFGWPGQSHDVWRFDLERALAADLGLAHLSLYSLIVEPGTPMAEAVARGVLVPVGDDESADLYETACDLLADAGWIHYEIANWTRERARQSRHNVIYWRNGDYAGFGAGAHWRIGNARRMNHLLPKIYIDAVEGGNEPASNAEEITPRISMGETMMLGLRLLEEGVTAAEFAARHGVSLEDAFATPLTELSGLGLLDWDGVRARLTQRGMMLANDVCARFL
ncbi:MAG: radical SAM family heme chaperone HemW [Thermomicrobiales bacterium]